MSDSEKRTGGKAKNFSAAFFGLIFLGLILVIPLLVFVSGIILISEGKQLWGMTLLVLGLLAGIGPFYRYLRSSKVKNDSVNNSGDD